MKLFTETVPILGIHPHKQQHHDNHSSYIKSNNNSIEELTWSVKDKKWNQRKPSILNLQSLHPDQDDDDRDLQKSESFKLHKNSISFSVYQIESSSREVTFTFRVFEFQCTAQYERCSLSRSDILRERERER